MKTIAIYPGRFQPFGKHHAATFMWVQNKFGKANSFIATSDIVDPFQNPFSFNEKKAIISAYGYGNNVKNVKNPYKAEEITAKFNPEDTAVVFIVGQKDLERLNVGNGYFLKYPGPNKPLKPLSENGYVLIAPHISLNVPGYGEMSGTQLRKALGDTSVSRKEKKKLFNDVFGWYSEKLATIIFDTLEDMYDSQLKEIIIREYTPSNPASIDAAVREIEKLGIRNPINPKEIVIDNSVIIEISNWDKRLWISSLYSIDRGKGNASAIMKKIVDIADKYKVTLALDPVPFGTDTGRLTKSQLINFYKKFGFDFEPGEEDFGDMERVAENKLFSKEWWSSLLQEGGAAGHMAHPFDLDKVKTGTDLVKVFADSVKSLQENPAAVKIDGVNTTLKVVTKDGKQQFALDRGSMNPLDVSGITVNDLGSRFAEGHGMLRLGKEVLEAFNACLPSIKSELSSLGMLKDPSILLNVETVIGDTSGKTNVIAYKENFFVIHGLLKSEQVTPKRRAQKEISGGAATIEKMVQKCKPIMQKMGYGIYGVIPTTVKKSITFTQPLNTSFAVKFNDKKTETKSLKQWLSAAKNPIDEKYKTISGKLEPVMTKKNYLALLNQTTNLDDITADPKEQKKLIDGAVMWHATRLMGTEVIKNLGSDVGDVAEHEGIVIRDPKIAPVPFKIVGEFIVSGLESGFGK